MVNTNKVIKNILGPQKRRGGKLDMDGDGVKNKKDCQPKNTMRQDRITDIAAHGLASMKQSMTDSARLDIGTGEKAFRKREEP